MCEHSQVAAREFDYKVIQLKLVASSNEGVVRLWKKLGFDLVGQLPMAFKHPTIGYVNAFILYKWLVPY